MDRSVSLALSLVLACAANAQDVPSQPDSKPTLDLSAVGQWALERIELKGGQVIEGLILPSPAGVVRISEVRRPPGRTYLIGNQWPAESVARIERLPPAEHARLAERIEQFRSLAGLPEKERPEMSQLSLLPGENGAQWVYDGPWFRLESWTDQTVTRRSILRIEQIFAAYSQILPARTKPQKPLRIRLYGSMRAYGAYQAGFGHRFQNPAAYSPKQNILAAGSELTAYAKRLHEVERHHDTIRDRYDQLAAAMPAELKKLADDLEKSGVPPDQRRNTRLAAERKWKEELNTLKRRLQVIERNNETQFDAVTGEMFARLYHEAFHAYLENFVYPQDRFEVPRWLNEGLAQVFEDGLLELGTLRLDAPNRTRLESLQADLRAAAPLSLAELLLADGRAFLVTHADNAAISQRLYLYSWGLAHYLAVREPILERSRLDRYVDRSNLHDEAIKRFEQLVGVPLSQFEAQWREELLAMKPAG